LIGNESGLSHLASSLNVPTLVIAGLKKRILQWQPGWGAGRIIYPPSWVPNMKGLRLRDHYWQKFITPYKVEREFAKLTAQSVEKAAYFSQ
jgi:ADP-heptose:LPS heptosyltransferase